MLNRAVKASAGRPSDDASLGELAGSIRTDGTGIRRAFRFAGPALLVGVGYMDPGNWATDLEGGSRFGYKLLWVILASSLMAMVLQTLCARLGIALKRDLAQGCRDTIRKPGAIALWILAEIAIIATDVAEVIGSAIALQLLFGIPLVAGVLITAFDVLLLLGLLRFGFRKIEALVFVLVLTIGVCFLINLMLAKPDLAMVAAGLIPRERLTGDSLAVAVGILGATVMPHNLYLHSAVVQTRAVGDDADAKRVAIRMATWDTLLALGSAFFVNAAILILAASTFYATGTLVRDLDQAHELLKPALGGTAATLFAVALLASGQSSTITGTFAGQVVMEGFTRWRLEPWKRRLITRLIAIVPAVILVSTQHGRGIDGLVLSQVILAMQLPFAVFPLVILTSSRKHMGEFASPPMLAGIGYAIGALVTLLNVQLLIEKVGLMPVAIGGSIIVAFAVWVMTRPEQNVQPAAL